MTKLRTPAVLMEVEDLGDREIWAAAKVAPPLASRRLALGVATLDVAALGRTLEHADARMIALQIDELSAKPVHSRAVASYSHGHTPSPMPGAMAMDPSESRSARYC